MQRLESDPPLSSLPEQPESRPAGSFSRQVIEFFVCLSIAVMLFKAFLIEGYVITTGSMAPTLLGLHKQVQCPRCLTHFAVGIPPNGEAPSRAVCPNCDESGIATDSLLANDGDQVLVNKSAYHFRWPHRWEVAVFRNPQRTSEAYVKRVVGIPGEQVGIQRGDVYVNGEIARKPLDVQRGLRILVHDHALQPPVIEGSEWQPRWIGDQPWWQPRGSGFAVDTRAEPNGKAQTAWLTYRHWMRSGGQYVTRLKLPGWPDDQPPENNRAAPISYDPQTQEISVRGALPAATRNRFRGLTTDSKFRAAIDRLYTESHIAPVTDFYAYNRQIPGNGDSAIVRDLMVATRIDFKAGQGEFRLEMSDGADVYTWVFDTRQQQIRLHSQTDPLPVRTAPLPQRFARETVLLEMSLFDRQVLCAMDGQLVFETWLLPQSPPIKTAPRRQIRLAAHGIRLHVTDLKVYRDLYYTPDGGGDTRVWQLGNSRGAEEFFVLGDNSPVSVDARVWPTNVVLTPQLLIGKPFMVHLPARTAPVTVGSWQGRLRVPDFSRIRYIR